MSEQTRPEQPTVPDRPSPDPRAAISALLASTQAQEQAAAVLREAGWTVRAPGEVVWVDDVGVRGHLTVGLDVIRDREFAIVGGDDICGEIRRAGNTKLYSAIVNGNEVALDYYPEARAAVEAALKGGAK
jgi:hypothetical protein